MSDTKTTLEPLFAMRCGMKIQLSRYEDSHLVDRLVEPWGNATGQAGELTFAGLKWQCQIQAEKVSGSRDAIDMVARFELVEGVAKQVNAGIVFSFDDWSKDNYMLMPGAVYNGNRFESRAIKYPPRLSSTEDIGPDIPTIISDVPRLNIHDGTSRIQLLARDLTTPAIGFHAPKTGKGLWCLTDEHTEKGPVGIFVEENADRSRCEITITSPGVREDVRYTICNSQLPSEDRGVDMRAGDEIVLRTRLHVFDCPEVQTLYDYFFGIRKELNAPISLKKELPFSETWKLLEEKYNRDNWREDLGIYTVGVGKNPSQIWQIGWIGGMMATCPLMFCGSEISRQRALRNFDFVFPDGIGASGFFHGRGDGQRWYGDGETFPENIYPHATHWHLIRKSADALYFILRQFILMRSQEPALNPKESWLEGTRGCADAFVRLWRRFGQFGQFVDIETGDVVVGGSTSGSTAPGALALASQFFDCDEYLEVAKASADYYYENFVEKGLTTGGPGEALQCPDSESAFGLLESFVVLYEVTADDEWIEKACDIANQCVTWVTSYDFKFPDESLFGRMGMSSLGTVWANAQNKHSAPGICTLSGSSLFKLYRATGNPLYLELIRDIAHSLPQYVSREDRPIGKIARDADSPMENTPSGWVDERVNISDWLEGIGEKMQSCSASCWSEVSVMLTCTELPGLYIQPDTAVVCAFDNVTAKIVEESNDKLVVEVGNPTKFEATVNVFVESSKDAKNILGQDYMSKCSTIVLASRGSHKLEITK